MCQALCHTEFPQEKIIMDKLAEIDRFKELLIGFYETNDSTKIKIFFRKKCLLVNPAYVKKDTMSDKTERSPMTMNV